MKLNNKNETKVLVLDIDGTLTNSRKEITPATKAAVLSVLEAGHKVILASGRPEYGLRRFERELGLDRYDGYLMPFNGARIIACRTNETVCQWTLPGDIIPEVHDFTKSTGCGLITYTADSILSAFEPDEYMLLESRINYMPIQIVENFGEYVDFPVNKCLISTLVEKAPGYTEYLAGKFGERVNVFRSEPFYIEIMPKYVDKAASLQSVVENFGICRENVICCGDGYNDISMLEYAGIGVAMGNAQPEVKLAADIVVATNDEDGIAEVVERFF